MRSKTITKGLLDKLSKLHNVMFMEISPLKEKGYRNKNYLLKDSSGNLFNLIVYKKEKGIQDTIRRANFVSNYLNSLGYPTRIALKTKNGRAIIKLSSKSVNKGVNDSKKNNERFACVYNFLPGSTIPWEGYTMKHIKLIGWVMSDMHYELSPFTEKHKALQGVSISNKPNLPEIFKIIHHQFDSMIDYFQQEGVKRALKSKLNLQLDWDHMGLLSAHLDQAQAFLAQEEFQTVLHMDLVRGNMLFSKRTKGQKSEGKYCLDRTTLSGVLDLEKVAVGPAVVDVARTLAFLLVDCKYKEDEKIRKYFLNSGYEKRGKFSIIGQLKFLEILVNFFWLYDFYKFLKHNPYEFLEQNEHYLRTKKRLVDNFLLKYR